MIRRIINPKDIHKEMFAMPWSIYPYANYLKYGVSKEFFSLYFAGNCFFTRYHDSIQICSESISDNEAKEVSNYIIENNIRMANGPTSCMNAIFDFLDKGRIEHGLIFRLKPFKTEANYIIKYANNSNEFHEISELVCRANSNNTGYYGLQQYYDQIFSRFSEKYCRNWICFVNNEIVGHIATYAETPLYGVLGGLAVNEKYRGQGIAKNLLSYSISNLNSENKDVYAFCYQEKLINFYNSISFSSFPTSKILFK